MVKLPGFDLESEVIATVVRWLIVLAANLVMANPAQEQCSDSAMGNDSDVAAATN